MKIYKIIMKYVDGKRADFIFAEKAKWERAIEIYKKQAQEDLKLHSGSYLHIYDNVITFRYVPTFRLLTLPSVSYEILWFETCTDDHIYE